MFPLLGELAHRAPTEEEIRALVAHEAADPLRLQALRIGGDRVDRMGVPGALDAEIRDRATLLREFWSGVEDFLLKERSLDPAALLPVAWSLWFPLSRLLLERVVGGTRWVQGLQGPVGSGKSLLSAVLARIGKLRGVVVATVSLDDLYRPFDQGGAERGPPGSHDVGRGLRLVEEFRNGIRPLGLPRFDKEARDGAGDRLPDVRLDRADILLLEGWFVGSLGAEAYRSLWEGLDDLWLLRAPSEDRIRAWRHDAEEGRRRRGRGLTVPQVDALLGRMLGALPPEEHGAVTPDTSRSAWGEIFAPRPSLVVDLDDRRTPVRVLPGP